MDFFLNSLYSLTSVCINVLSQYFMLVYIFHCICKTVVNTTWQNSHKVHSNLGQKTYKFVSKFFFLSYEHFFSSLIEDFDFIGQVFTCIHCLLFKTIALIIFKLSGDKSWLFLVVIMCFDLDY